jgi:hypothetical protein
MITQTNGIKTHCIENVYLDITTKLSKIGGSLTEIASMKKQHISLSFLKPHTIDISRLFHYSAMALVLATTLRLYMAMCVVEMKYGEILSLEQRRYSHQQHDKKISLHTYHFIVTHCSSVPITDLPSAFNVARCSRIASFT